MEKIFGKQINISMKKYNKILNVACSFFITSLLFSIILYNCDIWFGGKYTIFRGDFFSQYFPFIQNFISDVKSGNNIWYSFSLYYGSGTALTNAYYVFSPFNLLFFISGISVENITLIIIILKIGLCGMTFSIFLQKVLRKADISTIIFSISYALSGYIMILHYHIMWIDAWYMLPIIIWLVIRYVKEEKIWGLVFAYAYIFITNFYMAYIVGIFSFFVLCITIIREYSVKDERRKCIKILLKYCLGVAESVLLSAVVLVPALCQLIETNIGNDNSASGNISANIFDIFNAMFIGNMPSLNNVTPFLYCGILCLLIVPFYFLNKNNSRKDKIILGVGITMLVLSMLIKPLYLFWHAFDIPNYYAFRFSFLLLFVIIVIAAKEYDQISKVGIIKLLVYAIVLCLFYYIMYKTAPNDGYKHNTNEMLRLNALFSLAYIVCILIIKKWNNKCTNLLILIVMSIELVINGKTVINKEGVGISTNKYNQWYYSQKEAIDEIKNNDDDFYRIRINNDINYNSASLLGYNSVVSFCSTDSYALRKALANLGIMIEYHIIADKGYTDITEMLFGVRYNIILKTINSVKTNAVNKDNYVKSRYTKKDYFLPVGYLVDEKIVDYKFSDNQFENINRLASAMTGDEIQLFEKIADDNINVEVENAKIEYDSGIKYMHTNAEKAVIKYYVPHKVNRKSYICPFDNVAMDYKASPSIVGEPQGKYMGDILAFCNIVQGKYESASGADVWTIKMKDGKDYNMDELNFYYYNPDILKDVYEYLKDAPFTIKKYSNGYVDGWVNANKDGYVFFSIPYEKSWNAYVDGKKVEITPCVGNAFISIKVNEGHHDIVLKYIPRGLKVGEGLSCLGILNLIIVFLHKKGKKRLSKMTK